MKSSDIDNFLILAATDLGPLNTYKVLIELDEKLDPLNCQYFSKENCLGYKFFSDQDFKVIENCYKGCRLHFISILNPPRNSYAWLEEPD